MAKKKPDRTKKFEDIGPDKVVRRSTARCMNAMLRHSASRRRRIRSASFALV